MRRFSILVLAALSLPFVLSGCSSEPEHRVLSSDNAPISYDVQGKGHPALVFVHGWCCNRTYWKFQVPYFAKRHKVVTIDLAGHGQSGLGRRNWTMEAFGKDVAAVVEKLDLHQVILIGHSMGGPVIIEAARQMPERVIGLVGVDTFLDLDSQYTQHQIDAFVAPFERDFAAATSKLVGGMFLSDADPALVEWVVADMCLARPAVGIGAMRQLAGFDPKEALKHVRKPIYCINSDMRPTNIQAGQRLTVAFEVKLMSGVGHFVMLEDPRTFNKLLTQTISEISP